MGSKTRKLRKDAGFTGYEYRRNVKRVHRARVLADRVGSQVAVSSKHPSESRANVGLRRLLDEMAQRAGATREQRKAACLDPSLHEALVNQAQVFGLPLPDPLHWADYLSEIEGKAFGLGRVCRVCGNAKHVDGSKVTIAPSCAATATGSSEPAPGASEGPVLSLYGGEPRPPAAGMRLARRMPLLAQVAALSLLLAGEPPKGER